MRIVKFTFLWMLLVPVIIMAQSENGKWNRKSNPERSLFNVQSVQRLSENPDSIKIDLFIEVMYDLLQFVRDGKMFSASVELGLSISRDDSQILRLTKHLSAATDSYEKTNSRKESVSSVFSVELEPGDYDIHVQFRDRESKRYEKITDELKLVKPEQGIVNLSDIMLTRSTEINSESNVPLYPLVRKVISEKIEVMYCYFDLFRVQPGEITELSISLYDDNDSTLYVDSLSVVGGEILSSYFMKLSMLEVASGVYTVRIRAESGGSVTERLIEFRINLHGLPGSVKDIDMAIQQMKYIATEGEIRELEAAFPSDRERLFIEFWDDNFEVPGQLINGKMSEYYRRVEYANEHFADSRSGWESDRGQILIIYGQPTEIERSDISVQTAPYEIWRYHYLNKSFLFRDDYGFGEYKLITPVW